MQNAEALVLRTVDFSETSLIVTLYTREFGKIEALAKGGRRPKSSFESALDILARIRVTFLQKKGDALDLLTESKLISRFRANTSNLAGLYGGFYVAELVHSLTERDDPNAELFDRAVEALEQLQRGTFVMRALIRFEGLLLRSIGQQPSLDRCADCGAPVETDEPRRRRIPFGYLEGGILCERCSSILRREGGGPVGSVSGEAIRALQRLVDPEDAGDDWQRMPLSKTVLGEIRGLHNNYFGHLLGRKPRLYDWMKYISRNDREQTQGE